MVSVVDFPEEFEVVAHELGGVRGGEEVPVFPLGVAETFGGCFVDFFEVEGFGAGDLVGEGEEGETDAAVAVVEEEALDGCAAPVVADGNDAAAGYAFCVEDLGEGVGLLFVVVEVGWDGFGGAAEAQEVGEDEWVA